MEHGGWRSTTAARGYVQTTLADKLSVTEAITAAPPSAAPTPGSPPPRAVPQPSAQLTRPRRSQQTYAAPAAPTAVSRAAGKRAIPLRQPLDL